MAEACASVLGGDYLAGLWRSHLLQCLLWYNSATGNDVWEGSEQNNAFRRRKATRSSPCTAPSWWWASMDCPLQHRRLFISEDDYADGKTEFADIVACHVTTLSLYGLYEVTAGTLTITGRLKQAAWVLVDDQTVRWELTDTSTVDPTPFEERICTTYSDDPDDIGGKVWALLLYHKGRGTRWMEGLISNPVDSEGPLVLGGMAYSLFGTARTGSNMVCVQLLRLCKRAQQVA
jgi:hypothetical protein